MRKSPSYTAEDDRKLLEGHARGFSATAIIRHYFSGRKRKLTRNAVLSRLRKLRGAEAVAKEIAARKKANVDKKTAQGRRVQAWKATRRKTHGNTFANQAAVLLKAERDRQAKIEQLQHPAPRGAINDIPDGDGCRYVHGTPGAGDWRMCGHIDIIAGTKYCTFHAALCGVKPTNRASSKPSYVGKRGTPSI